MKQARAALDQDQDIARRDCAAFVFDHDRLTRGEHRGDARGDGIGQKAGVVIGGHKVLGVFPGDLIALGRLGDGGPEVDAARAGSVIGFVQHIGADTGRARAIGHPVDQRQDHRGRAEGIEQFAGVKGHIHLRQTRGEMVAHQVEPLGIGPLEGIDRLLLVTHDKDGAGNLGAGALACGKLGGECLDDLPLGGAGILRLIDKDMVDPAVEAKEHPLGHLFSGQKPPCGADQIVEIEPAAQRLGLCVAGQESGGKAVQRMGSARGHQPKAQGARIGHTFGQGIIGRDKIGAHRGAHLGAGEGFGRAFLFARHGQAGGLERGQIGQPHRRPWHGAEPRGQFGLCDDRVVEMGNQSRGKIALAAIQCRGDHLILGQIGGDPRPIADCRPIPRIGQRILRACHGAGQFAQPIIIGEQIGHRVDGSRRRALGHIIEQIGDQPGLHALVDLGEAGADARLEREAAQNRGAEGMDGLDLEAARCLDRAGKKRTRAPQPVGVDRILADLLQRRAQLGVRHHRPCAQALEQAVLHLHRGGLGIGQAQDAFGADPLQQ